MSKPGPVFSKAETTKFEMVYHKKDEVKSAEVRHAFTPEERDRYMDWLENVIVPTMSEGASKKTFIEGLNKSRALLEEYKKIGSIAKPYERPKKK